jgi:hypothetical protein
VPVDVARIIWERDDGRCAFVAAKGRRCSERRFLTIEHRHPFTRGGPSTPENLCLYCRTHNAYAAEQVFGAEFMLRKRASGLRPASHSEAPRGKEPAIAREAARGSDVEGADTARGTDVERTNVVRQRIESTESSDPPRIEKSQRDGAESNLDESSAGSGESYGTQMVGPASATRDPVTLVHGALRTLQFREVAIARALQALSSRQDLRDEQSLLRAALEVLVPNSC